MSASLALIRNFSALRERTEALLGKKARAGRGDDRPWVNYDPIDVLLLFERWANIRTELIATEPELAFLPECFPPKPSETSDNDGRGIITRTWIERLQRDMEDAWHIINHPSRQIPQISIDREGIFVAGQPFDAMVAVTSILRAAMTSITVVDGYVSEQVLNLLGVKADHVAAKILTKARSASATFVTHAKAFIAQYAAGPPLEIRTTEAFHDRFIVIDDTDYYHFGASIKDAAKKSAFMFSRIEEPTVMTSLRTVITTEWTAANVIPL